MWWIIIEGRPIVSVIVLVLATIAVMYFARLPVHRLLKKLARLIAHVLRLQAKAVARAVASLRERNREVLLEMGKGRYERLLNRDFHRVNEIIASDLANYPELQKHISMLVTRLEEDYHRSAETSPPSPDWVEAIEAIVNLKEAQKGNPVIVKLLEDLYGSLEYQQKKTLLTYRNGVSERHKILHAMMPSWRRLNNAVERVGASMRNMIVQAEEIDKNMDQYREINAGTEKAERMLQVSALRELVVALFWMTVFVGGAYLNFNLIALPMSEIVGVSAMIAGFTVADVSALMIVLIEIAIGMLLMEVLHITRMFPAIGALDERKRRILFWLLLGFITVFASIEAGLAFMRDQITADNAALSAMFIGGEMVALEVGTTISQLIPQAAQMLLGFFLPFALIFVAVPFESLLESSRIVLARAVVLVLQLLHILIKTVAAMVGYTADIVLAVYDIVIALPLWVEHQITQYPSKSTTDVRLAKD